MYFNVQGQSFGAIVTRKWLRIGIICKYEHLLRYCNARQHHHTENKRKYLLVLKLLNCHVAALSIHIISNIIYIQNSYNENAQITIISIAPREFHNCKPLNSRSLRLKNALNYSILPMKELGQLKLYIKTLCLLCFNQTTLVF